MGFNGSPVASSPVTSAAGVGLATIAGRRNGARRVVPRTRNSTCDGPSRHGAAVGRRGARRTRRSRRPRRRPRRRDGFGPHDHRRAGRPPADAYDAYLRLHLLSHRLIKPHDANVDGIFGVLTNVVWTNHGPCAVEGFENGAGAAAPHGARSRSTASTSSRGWSTTSCPTGVRIADADRVRLGAHLAPGTTVMHEGFVNFNAGTLGASMVEGRISAGVVVGDGSDIGGGASIMGTLSGGGTQVISIGKRCLLGANAGLGISLGDDCVVEAGLYLTAGTKVTDARRHDGQGARAVRRQQPTVPPQFGDRRGRGGVARRPGHRAQRGSCTPISPLRIRIALVRARMQNSLPSGSASTTQLCSPWPMSTCRAPSPTSRSTSAC